MIGGKSQCTHTMLYLMDITVNCRGMVVADNFYVIVLLLIVARGVYLINPRIVLQWTSRASYA